VLSDLLAAVRLTGFFVLFFVCLLVTTAGAQPVCLNLRTARTTAHHSIAVGERLSLVFPHSIYGSRVEEQFSVTPKGFQLLELRYAEPRLVEFYGHESAANEDGMWIVRQRAPVLTVLDLLVSPDSRTEVIFGTEKLTVKHDSVSEGRARLTVSACPRSNYG
jgi:hypothetical protein